MGVIPVYQSYVAQTDSTPHTHGGDSLSFNWSMVIEPVLPIHMGVILVSAMVIYLQ